MCVCVCVCVCVVCVYIYICIYKCRMQFEILQRHTDLHIVA